MSGIGGTVREKSENTENYGPKQVGLFEANVVAVNPTIEQYSSILGRELKEDSKAVEYLGTSSNGNSYLRLDFWLEEVKSKNLFKVTFFLEDQERENRDGSKKQYINNIGTTSWASDESDLPNWFSKDRDYRVAYVGEENLYTFLRTWLNKLNYKEAATTLQLDWNKLMKNNVKELSNQINGEFSDTVLALATVIVKERDGEAKEYQGVYNKAFLPGYALKQFRNVDYTDVDNVSKLTNKASRDLQFHERFITNVAGEYGCKDYYILKEIEDYNSDDNLVASDDYLDESADY